MPWSNRQNMRKCLIFFPFLARSVCLRPGFREDHSILTLGMNSGTLTLFPYASVDILTFLWFATICLRLTSLGFVLIVD